jgi:hypothetical protein
MTDGATILTIWASPDDLWERVEWLLNKFDPPKSRVRKRAPCATDSGRTDLSLRKYPPRCLAVERTFGWLSRRRGLLARYEKKSENYLGLLQFARVPHLASATVRGGRWFTITTTFCSSLRF